MSSLPALDSKKAQNLVDTVWGDTVVPALTEYIKIPNKSPMFDEDWQKNGYMKNAADLIVSWCNDHAPKGMKLELIELPGRTPLIFIDIPGQIDDTVMLYGHYDKQPEMTGWDSDLGPWKPVLKGDKLYGRGGADDGYSTFGSLLAINVLQEQGIPHPRCVVLIEGCEESGSFDLPFYIDHLQKQNRIGKPSLVVCLDSGAGNYDQMWCTTSLRGMVTGNLVVELIKEGVHSGDASGIVPSSFRVARELLDKIEESKTGKIIPSELYVEIPRQRIEQAQKVADALGAKVYDHFPFHPGVKPLDVSNAELILNRTWRPQLAYTGAGGLPSIDNAGNVMRPETSLKLSFRLPPTADSKQCLDIITKLFENDPPYSAKVSFSGSECCDGWNAPALAPWLDDAMNQASQTFFGAPAMSMGEGGTIPFMGMLGEKFPDAQFMITGVLGPESNAHGPNEFLHLPTARKLTSCVADVIRTCGARKSN